MIITILKKIQLLIKKIKIVKLISKKCNLKISSITCDFYMEKPIVQCRSDYLKKQALSKIFQLINSCKIHKINKIIIPLVDNSSLKIKMKKT